MTCIVHTARIINKIDILALPRRHVIHQLCIEPSSSGILRNSVVRASDWCTEGHWFNSCQGLRFFSLSLACDMLITPFVIIVRHYALYKETETLLLLPYTDLLWSLKNNNLCLIYVFLGPKVISFNSTLFLFLGSSEMNWHLLIMLESALKASPSNHHLKLLLMRVYCSMGE